MHHKPKKKPKCLSCGKAYGRKLTTCPNCLLINFELEPDNSLPENYRKILAESHKIISPVLTEKKCEELLLSASKKLDFRPL